MPKLIAFLFALCVVAGCSEKPHQQLMQSGDEAAQRDQRSMEDARRQRTLGQNESARIYNEGSLR